MGQSVLHCLTEQKHADLNHGWRVEVETNKKLMCVEITRVLWFPWAFAGRFIIISPGLNVSFIIKGYLMMYESRRLIATLWNFVCVKELWGYCAKDLLTA